MKRKMNAVLQTGVEEEQAYEKRRDKLKKKFGIRGKNVVVVERGNTATFMIKMMIGLVKLIATIAVISFAFIGLVALFYEEPRQELLVIFKQVLKQIQDSLPFFSMW